MNVEIKNYEEFNYDEIKKIEEEKKKFTEHFHSQWRKGNNYIVFIEDKF
jgi:hypothetical protein